MPFVPRLEATILVVDDEEPSRELIARLLRGSGFDVHAVSSTSDAHTALASGAIELMLCDVMMPDESGPEFLARLRSENPDLPVIMVSGISNTNIAQVALDYGAYSYITKPFSADQLRIAVSGALHRRDWSSTIVCSSDVSTLRAPNANETFATP